MSDRLNGRDWYIRTHTNVKGLCSQNRPHGVPVMYDQSNLAPSVDGSTYVGCMTECIVKYMFRREAL